MYNAPRDLGFNDKLYPEWRTHQLDAIEKTITGLDTADLVALNMPVGSGKSLVALAVARLYLRKLGAANIHGKVVILTATKTLMDQYVADLNGSRFRYAEVRGASNYTCLALQKGELPLDVRRRFPLHPTYPPKCDHGPCQIKVDCHRKEAGCLYYDAIGAFKSAQFGITNYSMWLTRALGDADLLICDEGHLLESEIDKAARIHHPDMPTASIKAAQEWAVKRDKLLANKELTVAIKRERRTLARIIAIDNPDNYVYVNDGSNAGWSPIMHSKEGDLLAESSSKFMVLSGTTAKSDIARFRNSIASRKMSWLFYDYPSLFPKENRPVYCYPVRRNGANVGVSFKNDDATKVAIVDHQVRIVQAMRPSTRKGAIHPVSYDKAESIYRALVAVGLSDLVYYPRKASQLAYEIKRFKVRPQGGILISPAITTGLSFDNELCRWQIISKLPFPNTTNPLVKARCAIDPDYATAHAIKTVEQMVGRGVRSSVDWCDTFIVDNNYWWAVHKEGMASQHLLESSIMLNDSTFSSMRIRVV